MGKENMRTVEEETSFVFGETFKQYNKEELRRSIDCLKTRLVKNNISLDVFKDKICLDAGCGGGRASIMMCELGAKKVYAVDRSIENFDTVQKIRNEFNFPILAINDAIINVAHYFDSDYFDIIWCNGVLHHTTQPTEGLKILVNLLKPNGYMWLYLYGAGGVYWQIIDQIREELKDISTEEVLRVLQTHKYPADKIAEFMDDWKVPILERYTAGNVEAVLACMGMSYRRLWNGLAYDTCYRREKFEESTMMGEGDLRYWCQKKEVELQDVYYMNRNDEINIKPPYKKEVANIQEEAADIQNRIKYCADLQTKLRDRMSKDERFDLEKFKEEI